MAPTDTLPRSAGALARRAAARAQYAVVAHAVGALAIVAAALALLSAPPAAGARAPRGWQRYVLGSARRDARPVRIAATSGDVERARSLIAGGGSAKLRMRRGGPAPVILLDYGRDVGGIPYLRVTTASGSPQLRASFSESRRFADLDGDNGGEGPCCGLAAGGAEPHRYDDFVVQGPGPLKTALQQGGERFERITLRTPGSVTLSAAGIRFRAYRAPPRRYRGWFESSGDLLNRIWYAGAYTLQLDMVPPGTQNGNSEPVVIDGAKRDRAVWSGDMAVEGPVIWATLGANGAPYVEQSLLKLAREQTPSGALPGVSKVGTGVGVFYSASYSMHAANAIVEHFRRTGDRGFARRTLAVVERQLAYDATLLDGRGLLVTTGASGQDWDIYDGPKSGAVTAYNAIYYHALREAAYLERHLGRAHRARAYGARAARVRRAINAVLLDRRAGLYVLSDRRRRAIAQDGNALAVLYGVAPRGRVDGILTALRRRLWTPHGSEPFSASAGYSDVISPFAGGFETAARLAAGRGRGALELIRRLWGLMVRPGPDYTGALWEKLSARGTVGVLSPAGPIDNPSLAHGWSAGPTWQLSQYVLGVAPVAPGYRTWRLRPQPGGLRWARGRVPTPHGPFDVSWSRAGSRLRLRLQAPHGTRGTVAVPVPRRARVTLDGRPAIPPRGGARRCATRRARSVALRIRGGSPHRITVARCGRSRRRRDPPPAGSTSGDRRPAALTRSRARPPRA